MQRIISALNDTLKVNPIGAKRIFHGRGHCYDGLEGVTVDWFNPVVFVCLYKAPSKQWLAEFKESLQNSIAQFGTEDNSVLIQFRYLQGAPTEPLCGPAINELVVQEHDLKYKVRFGAHQNTGLFLDMAKGRQWVKENTQSAKVLNLFAYTCAFSVAAIAGGAQQVVNVDMAKGPLSWGRDNHRLNQHPLERVKFFAHDVLRSWGKLRKLGPYDLIIVDPPSYQKGSFVAKKDYAKMSERLTQMLQEGGKLLACLNAPELPSSFLRSAMENEHLVFQERLQNPETFPELDEEKSLKVMVFKRA